MPIYEEKLISPLALRFTQQRIRMTFRDGRKVEDSIREITAGPAAGNYDIVLHAPFPTIEIIRYSPNGRGAGEDDHWFTFDNRRLYCLQRVAAQYWPKRVGAVVEVLYADNGAIRKKLDSLSCGLSVDIGHAFATADQLEHWDWHVAVEKSVPPGLGMALEAEAAVDEDDAKRGVDELMAAPGVPSSVDRLAMALAVSTSVADVAPRSRTISEDSSRATQSTAATEAAPSQVKPTRGKRGLRGEARSAASKADPSGTWTGPKGETYTVSCKGSHYQCVRKDRYGSKWFTVEDDKSSAVLWWGIQRTYYVCTSELSDMPDQLRWYGASDPSGRHPRFVWHKTQEVNEDEHAWQAEEHAGWAMPEKAQAKQTKSNTKSQNVSKQQRSIAQHNRKWVAVANTGGA